MASGQRCGPWGNSADATNWDFDWSPCKMIQEVLIWAGYVVDGIGFVTVDNRATVSTERFGNQGGRLRRIVLAAGEYITHISGTYGVYKHNGRCNIATITIHTNSCPAGYGPHGHGRDVSNVRPFSTTFQPGRAVVHVFGRADQYLESIGVYIK